MGKVNFFHGDRYKVFDVRRDTTDFVYVNSKDPYFGANISNSWKFVPSLPANTGFDAALNVGTGLVACFVNDKIYFYNTVDDYVEEVVGLDSMGMVGLDRVDACINWGNKVAYFLEENNIGNSV